MTIVPTLLLALFSQEPAPQSQPQSQPQSRPAAPVQLAAVLAAGVRWLVAQRTKDGHWRAEATAGSKRPTADTLPTGLALLALLGMGSSLADGPHQAVVRDGVHWLIAQQDKDGFVGPRAATMAMAGHAVAALALSETNVLSPDETTAAAAQRAIQHLLDARSSGAIWTRDPRGGPEDRWALVWAVLALRSARDARMSVDADALAELTAWLERHTDVKTGEMPVDAAAGDATNAATRAAGGLLCRFFLGQEPRLNPVMVKAADLVAGHGPQPARPGAALDAGFVYLGTAALYQAGGAPWSTWSRQLTATLASSQRTDGEHAGSWNPPSPDAGGIGRVGSTALVVLGGQIHARAARVVAGR